MSHLSVERIAALVDESPTPAELQHLLSCPECAQERTRFASLGEFAKTAPVISAPITSWDRLAPALRSEGLIVGAPRAPRLIQSLPQRRAWMQAAAAIVLVTGGMLAGRASAGARVLPVALGNEITAPKFRSVSEAEKARLQGERLARAATMYLVNSDSSAPAVTPRTLNSRMALLGSTIQALNEDLHGTHNDPVITSMRETAKAQYDATIRQLNTARPTSLTMTVY